MRIAELPADGQPLAFDAVPMHLGPRYLIRGAFDIAVAHLRGASGIAARSEALLPDPGLLRRALAEPTCFLVYDVGTNRAVDLTCAAWLAWHPAVAAQ
jgi:hypothetical protein